MKFLIFAVAGLVVALSSAEDSSNFIIGGDDASIEDYPYMAGIMHLGRKICGGTIINERSVLTAAHCILLPFAAPTVSVFVGATLRTGYGGQVHRAVRVFMHPDYHYVPEPFEIEADIAVIRTITRIRFGRTVQPIPLGINPVPAGARVLLTGWGLVGQNPSTLPTQLQRLNMNSITNLRCALSYRGNGGGGLITSEKICVVADNNRGACSGDSGGPITWFGNVVGVVSWGNATCGTTPSVFIRVSYHLRWIQSHL